MGGKNSQRPELPEAVVKLLRAAPVKDRAGLYQKTRQEFSAAAEPELPDLKFARITGVELARAGEWNGIPVSNDDLDTLVRSYDSGYFAAPVVLLNHEDADDQFASGWVERLYWRGDTVCADFADVDDWAAYNIQEARLLYPSLMAKNDFTRLYHIALLGGANPAVEGLAKLKDALIQDVRFSANQDEVLVFACASPETEDTVMPEGKKEKLTLLQAFAQALGFKMKPVGDDEVEVEGGGAGGDPKKLLEFQRRAETAEAETEKLRKEREGERKATRLSRAQAQVKELQDGNFITPAVADAGLAELLAFLAEDEAKVAFSRKDGGSEEATRAERLVHAFKQLTRHRLKDEMGRADPPGGENESREEAIERRMAEEVKKFAQENPGEKLTASRRASIHREVVAAVDNAAAGGGAQ